MEWKQWRSYRTAPDKLVIRKPLSRVCKEYGHSGSFRTFNAVVGGHLVALKKNVLRFNVGKVFSLCRVNFLTFRVSETFKCN